MVKEERLKLALAALQDEKEKMSINGAPIYHIEGSRLQEVHENRSRTPYFADRS